MRPLPCILLMSLGCIFLQGCNPPQQTTTIDGSSTVFPISERVSQEYLSENPSARIVVKSSGTGGGISSFSRGEIDICDASRAMKDSERADCEKAGIKFTEFTIAYDGIAVVTNKENDWCKELSIEQLKKLWQDGSTVKSWRDLDANWPDHKFDLYGPDENSGTYDFFNEVILGKDQACRDDYNPSSNDNQLVRGVQQDKGALGYFGYAYYAENKDTLNLIPIKSGDTAIAPSVKTVRDGSYTPLSRPLFIYVNNKSFERKEVREYIKLYIEQGTELVEEVGYVPVPNDTIKENKAKLEELMKAAA